MGVVETAIKQIKEDGYAIIANLISGDRLRRAQEDAEALLEKTPIAMPGLDGRIIGRMKKGLFRATRAFDDLYVHPTILAVARGVLTDAESKSYLTLAGGGIQLSTVMIKDVVPRENVRHMHRDDAGYPIARPRAPLMVNMLLALDQFSKATGGTLVVPGSHKWTKPVEQDADHIVVEMDAGSIVMFDGAIWHNNGANHTTDRSRKALNIYYSLSWLRQVEGPYLGLTTDQVKELPQELQAII